MIKKALVSSMNLSNEAMSLRHASNTIGIDTFNTQSVLFYCTKKNAKLEKCNMEFHDVIIGILEKVKEYLWIYENGAKELNFGEVLKDISRGLGSLGDVDLDVGVGEGSGKDEELEDGEWMEEFGEAAKVWKLREIRNDQKIRALKDENIRKNREIEKLRKKIDWMEASRLELTMTSPRVA